MGQDKYVAILREGKQRFEFTLNGGPINVPIGAEAIFFALGRGAAAWGRLEQHIDALLMQVNKEQHSSEILSLFNPNHPRPFTDKIRLLKKYFNKHPALKEHTESIRDFAREAKLLAEERNTYLHGILESYDEAAKEIRIKAIRPLYDPKNPYLFRITESTISPQVLRTFADVVNQANDKLETISRAIFTEAAVSQLRKPSGQADR